MLTAFLASTGSILLAEIGDKTQLLTLFLALRFQQQKMALIAGITAATLANHLVSAWLGIWLRQWLSDATLAWVVGGSFIAVGLWLLIPDKTDDNTDNKWFKHSAFVATFILFFLAEIGDKTQIATVLLAAKYSSMWIVVLGSVLGLLLANIPMIYLGKYILNYIPLRAIRISACILFCTLGVLSIWY